MPMIPMGAEQQMMGPEDEMAAAGPVPVGPGDPDPMMDEPEPQPEEIAMMLGAQINMEREAGHAMVEQAANERLMGVMAMIAQSAQGAQVMGPGQIA